jgi:hypothetical protein
MGYDNVPMTPYHGPQHWTRYMKKWTLEPARVYQEYHK